MTDHDERMCELQADVFELSAERFSCGSEYFAARFMHSEAAKRLDNAKDDFNYSTPETLLLEMSSAYPSLDDKNGKKLPSHVLRWIGYVYRAFCIEKKWSSADLYKELKPEELHGLYDSFHTFSIEYCVSRLFDLINERRGRQKSDYEIYRAIRIAEMEGRGPFVQKRLKG